MSMLKPSRSTTSFAPNFLPVAASAFLNAAGLI